MSYRLLLRGIIMTMSPFCEVVPFNVDHVLYILSQIIKDLLQTDGPKWTE